MHPACVRRYVSTHLSTVARGTAFENRSLRILQDNLSMSLTRVGGKSDGGVDLVGWWWVPSPGQRDDNGSGRRRIRVLAQCKAESRKMGPGYIRELEGVVYKFLAESSRARGPHPATVPAVAAAEEVSRPREEPLTPVVALLISQSPFTRASLLAAQSSTVPLYLLHLPSPNPPHSPREPSPRDADSGPHASPETPPLAEGAIGTAFWNAALASTRGILGGEMELRWERTLPEPNAGLFGLGRGRPALWWRGQRLANWVPQHSSIQ